MNPADERRKIWSEIDQPWDIIIIGGGITGSGILREATRLNLRTLLIEQRDFAWGTSSRSSKLVHGGFRYLKEGRIDLTRASVLERERLLAEGPGLIDPLGFLLSIYMGDSPGRWTFQAGLTIYDLLALQWGHRYYSAADFQMLAPHISQSGLEGGFRYGDAQTDDARLVLRLLQEAIAAGGVALNYIAATDLIMDSGKVVGLCLVDNLGEFEPVELRARVVISATGAWADHFRQQVDAPARIRPLRGSHLIFPAWRLPVAQAVSFLHPLDQRPVFAFPWEGVTLVGTTDIDHRNPLELEPHISPDEVRYLMAAVNARFPSLGIGLADIVSTFAGVRPVIGSGKADPSQESRDHVVWDESGLLTVTGGKMTTFRLIALDALKAVRDRLPNLPEHVEHTPVLDSVDPILLTESGLSEPIRRRLLGRYGINATDLVAIAHPGELEPIPGTETLWAELRWAARSEGVCHLEDLMLRRVRLGLLLPRGGEEILPVVRQICQAELGWDDIRWQSEQAAYLKLWRCCYALPEGVGDLVWEIDLNPPKEQSPVKRSASTAKWIGRSLMVSGLLGTAISLWLFYRQRKKNA